MISYESCNWYTRLWRKRWYLYAIFLYIKTFINIDIIVDLVLDFLMEEDYSSKEKKKLKSSWKDIKKHIELSKMFKFSTKYERED